MVRVWKCNRKWIKKDRGRIFKGDTVLPEIGCCLLRVPLKRHITEVYLTLAIRN